VKARHTITEKTSISKGKRREQEILQTAADVFFRKGFHATSLEDIAKVIGIRKSSLYYYVQTKDELLFRIVQRGLQSMTDQLQVICRGEGPPSEKLRKSVENHITAYDTQYSTLGVNLREERSIASQYRKDYLAIRDTYEALFRGLISEGVATGAFRTCDPATMTRAILGMVNWLAIWYHPGGPLTASSLSSQFTEFILKGLQKANTD